MLTSVLSVLLAAAAAQAPASPPPAQEDAGRDLPRIGVETELVELDVVVTDGEGRPVTDLAPDSFELLEDGRPRPITHFVPGFTAVSRRRARPPAPLPGPAARSPAPPPAEVVPRARHLVLAVDDLPPGSPRTCPT